MAPLLTLDGQLGPLSFALRRVIALGVVTVFAASSITWGPTPPIRAMGSRRCGFDVDGRAAFRQQAIVGYVVGLAAIATAHLRPETRSCSPPVLFKRASATLCSGRRAEPGAAVEFAGAAIAEAGSRYIRLIGGAGDPPEPDGPGRACPRNGRVIPTLELASSTEACRD